MVEEEGRLRQEGPSDGWSGDLTLGYFNGMDPNFLEEKHKIL